MTPRCHPGKMKMVFTIVDLEHRSSVHGPLSLTAEGSAEFGLWTVDGCDSDGAAFQIKTYFKSIHEGTKIF